MDAFEKFVRLVMKSGLSESRFSRWVMGLDESAIGRWRQGGKIPSERRSWMQRLQSVTVEGDDIVIVVRRGAAGRMLTRHYGRGAGRVEGRAAAKRR